MATHNERLAARMDRAVKLERGAVVRMRGQLTLYEARGHYQLIARMALPAGEGDLHAQFERIRKKLDAEGLMSDARKRPLPRFPRVVGVVDPPSGEDQRRHERGRNGRDDEQQDET